MLSPMAWPHFSHFIDYEVFLALVPSSLGSQGLTGRRKKDARGQKVNSLELGPFVSHGIHYLSLMNILIIR